MSFGHCSQGLQDSTYLLLGTGRGETIYELAMDCQQKTMPSVVFGKLSKHLNIEMDLSWVHESMDMDVGQNGRPRGPQMLV